MILTSLLSATAIVTAFLLGTFLVWKQARKSGLSEERMIDFCVGSVFWGIVGGRLAHVVLEWSVFQPNLLRTILLLKYPGFSIPGAIVFFIGSLIVFGYSSRMKVANLLDMFSVPLLVSVLVATFPCTSSNCTLFVQGRFMLSYFGLIFLTLVLQKIRSSLHNHSKYNQIKHKSGLVFFLSSAVLISFGLLLAKGVSSSLYFVGITVCVAIVLGIIFWYWELVRMIKLPSSVLGQIKKYLEDRVRETEHRMAQLKREDPTTDKDRLHTESSDDDVATDKAKHERIEVLQTQLTKSVIEMRKALTKIKVGSYGNCENCHKLIDTDRLAAFPQATLCLDCEKKREKGKK